jgi:hypothetical protein
MYLIVLYEVMMRCDVCYTWIYPFFDIFDMKPIKIHTLCESCYSKHPVFIDIETLPNEGSLIHIMHLNYDGVYKIDAYGFIEDSFIQFFMYKKVTILITNNLEETLLERVTHCDLGMIWILNYNTTQ